MSELTGVLRERGAHVPNVGNVRRFVCRLVKHDRSAKNDIRGVKRTDLSWFSKWLASSDQQVRAPKAEPYWAWYERGETLRGSGRYEDALANFDRALELKPDCARAWHARGRTLAELGRYFEAVASYMTALKLEPTNLFIRQDRATALADLKRQRLTPLGGRSPSSAPRPSLTVRHTSPPGTAEASVRRIARQADLAPAPHP